MTGALYICGPGPMETLETHYLGIKWCFRCRAKVMFFDRLRCELGRSYYGPEWERTCENDHLDGDLFPGWSRT